MMRSFVVMFSVVLLAAVGIYWLLSLLAGPPDPTVPSDSSTLVTVITPATSAGTSTDSTSSTNPPATTTTSPATTTTAPTSPSEITVEVLNSTRRAGIAADLTAELEKAGYQTNEPSNYGNALKKSRVWYRKGLSAEAKILADEFVPDAIVESFPGGIDTDAGLVVIIGASYQE